MRAAFEIKSFPDLSLPRYYDLFGEETLTVAATRLFTWLQITSSTRERFSFCVRYTYDPKREPSNRRLRIHVVIDTPDDAIADSLTMGRRLAAEVMEIADADSGDASPAAEDAEFFSVLERKERLVLDKAGAVYLPAVWTRQATARNALEPYLDEAFAALTSPAFLEIQLHSCEPGPARQLIQSLTDQLERRKQTGSDSGRAIAW